jgi:hypothetical protein
MDFNFAEEQIIQRDNVRRIRDARHTTIAAGPSQIQRSLICQPDGVEGAVTSRPMSPPEGK